MTDKKKPRRLSETVIPGKDYAEKVKLESILASRKRKVHPNLPW